MNSFTQRLSRLSWTALFCYLFAIASCVFIVLAFFVPYDHPETRPLQGQRMHLDPVQIQALCDCLRERERD